LTEAHETDPLVGQLLDGRYQIVREIAVGGMSTVYEAIHVKIGRVVAIKVLHRDMAGDPELVGRFLNEARAVGTFGHPNIVASTDFGELPGHVPYLVLEYLRGRTLSDDIATHGPLPVRRTVRIAFQIASALHAAHARDVIHRDLTSSNIFLTETEGNPDHVKVLDFGISKFLTGNESGPKTRRGLTMGTPEFMAPEQIADPQSVDRRVDIYALGVIMFHMLQGHPPFGGVPLQSLLTQIVVDAPMPIDRDDLPEGIRAIVSKALSKDPADRFPSMQAMGTELARFGSRVFTTGELPESFETPSAGLAPRSHPGPARRTPNQSTSSSIKPNPSRRVLYAAAGLIALAAGVLAVSRLRPREATPSPAPPPIASSALPPLPVSAKPSVPVEPQPIHVEVNSPTPQARVTIRGRTHPLPFSQELKPGSQPEVIELTAPGREGKRFWITFDRPATLAAELPAGRGVIQASEEETLLALGESSDAPDDAAPGGADRRAPGSSRHSSHHPRIVGGSEMGKGATPKPTASEPAGASPLAAALPPAAPAKVAEPPAEIAPPVASSPAPAAAKTNPSAPAAPAAGHATAQTGLDPAKTQAAVRSHLPEIQRCYERGKMDDAELKGRVTMRISVSVSGAVSAATVETSTLHSGSVEGCMMGAVLGWKLPAPVGGPAIISYPFNLH
jgi:serine/threonine protein kinase